MQAVMEFPWAHPPAMKAHDRAVGPEPFTPFNYKTDPYPRGPGIERLERLVEEKNLLSTSRIASLHRGDSLYDMYPKVSSCMTRAAKGIGVIAMWAESPAVVGLYEEGRDELGDPCRARVLVLLGDRGAGDIICALCGEGTSLYGGAIRELRKDFSALLKRHGPTVPLGIDVPSTLLMPYCTAASPLYDIEYGREIVLGPAVNSRPYLGSEEGMVKMRGQYYEWLEHRLTRPPQ